MNDDNNSALKNDLGKLYLISVGLLERRCWRRRRQYAYTALCWHRHEKKELQKLIPRLWWSLTEVCKAEQRQRVYNSYPLRTRTRMEKLLAAPQPLSAEDTKELELFYFSLNMMAL